MALRYKYGTARILLVWNDLLDLGCFCPFASICLSTFGLRSTTDCAADNRSARAIRNRSKIWCLINVEKALECSTAEPSAASPRVFAN